MHCLCFCFCCLFFFSFFFLGGGGGLLLVFGDGFRFLGFFYGGSRVFSQRTSFIQSVQLLS